MNTAQMHEPDTVLQVGPYSVADALGPRQARERNRAQPVTVEVQFSTRDLEMLTFRARGLRLTLEQHLYECALADLASITRSRQG